MILEKFDNEAATSGAPNKNNHENINSLSDDVEINEY